MTSKKENSETKNIHPQYDRQFIESSIKMTLDFLETTLKGENKVIDLKLPAILSQEVDFNIEEKPCEKERLLKACKQVLDNQAKPYHPHFHNTLFGGFDQFSLIGAMMTPCINGTVYTYEMSSCWTLMEDIFYEKLRDLLSWGIIQGTMTPGGSFANFMAIQLAKHQAYPETKSQGIFGCQPMKIFISEVAHYSLKKGAILCGMGLDSIVLVKTDQCGRMIPDELEKAIQNQKNNGYLPLLVVATVGTTVEGSIDPVTEMGEVCKKHKIWFHVDACFGGAFLMSPTLIQKLGSFENVDSASWDPHKALVVPLQATFFICKRKNLLKSSNSVKADYLFHEERADYTQGMDVGQKSLQCGRVIDILKLWTYIKGNGWENIAKQVQCQHNLALYVKEYVQKRGNNWKLAIEAVDTFNVCFWYIPNELRVEDYDSEDQFYKIVSKVTVLAKKFMISEGKILIGYSKSKDSHYYWRTVMSNPFIQNKDIDFEMEHIAKYCQMAYQQISKTTQ